MNTQNIGGSEWVLVKAGESFDSSAINIVKNNTKAPFTHIVVVEDAVFSSADFAWKDISDVDLVSGALSGIVFVAGMVIPGTIKTFTLTSGSVMVFRG